MLVIKPLWVAHVPQDATIYSGELRSKADVRSYTKKSKYKNIWTQKCIFAAILLYFQDISSTILLFYIPDFNHKVRP